MEFVIFIMFFFCYKKLNYKINVCLEMLEVVIRGEQIILNKRDNSDFIQNFNKLSNLTLKQKERVEK